MSASISAGQSFVHNYYSLPSAVFSLSESGTTAQVFLVSNCCPEINSTDMIQIQRPIQTHLSSQVACLHSANHQPEVFAQVI